MQCRRKPLSVANRRHCCDYERIDMKPKLKTLNPQSRVEECALALVAAIETDAKFLGAIAGQLAIKGELSEAHSVIDAMPAIQEVLKKAEGAWEAWASLWGDVEPAAKEYVPDVAEPVVEAPKSDYERFKGGEVKPARPKKLRRYDYNLSAKWVSQAIIAHGGFMSASQMVRAMETIRDTMGGEFFEAATAKTSVGSMARQALRKYMQKRGIITNVGYDWVITPAGRTYNFD